MKYVLTEMEKCKNEHLKQSVFIFFVLKERSYLYKNYQTSNIYPSDITTEIIYLDKYLHMNLFSQNLAGNEPIQILCHFFRIINLRVSILYEDAGNRIGVKAVRQFHI